MTNIKLKRFRYFCLLILVFMLHSCSVVKYNRNDFIGVYERPKYNERLIFTDSSFVYFRDIPNHGVSFSTNYDSLSFGIWSLVKGVDFLSLTSPEHYLKSRVNIIVREHTAQNNDTVRFVIHSPLEKAYSDGRNNFADAVIYSVYLETLDGHLLNEVKSQGGSRSIIEFVNPKHEEIKFILILATAGPEFPIRILGTDRVSSAYFPIHKTSNRFEIDIPELTPSFLAMKRLDRDFIKIVSKSKLEWDGIIYEKY